MNPTLTDYLLDTNELIDEPIPGLGHWRWFALSTKGRSTTESKDRDYNTVKQMLKLVVGHMALTDRGRTAGSPAWDDCMGWWLQGCPRDREIAFTNRPSATKRFCLAMLGKLPTVN